MSHLNGHLTRLGRVLSSSCLPNKESFVNIIVMTTPTVQYTESMQTLSIWE